MMRPLDLLQRLWRRPFQPFRLLVTIGVAYEIRHPELLLVGRSTVTLAFAGSKYPFPAARREVEMALIPIVQLETIEPAVSPSANRWSERTSFTRGRRPR